MGWVDLQVMWALYGAKNKQHHRATLNLSHMKQFKCCAFNFVINKTDWHWLRPILECEVFNMENIDGENDCQQPTLKNVDHWTTHAVWLKLRRLTLTIAGWWHWHWHWLLTIDSCRMVVTSLLQIMMGVDQCSGRWPISCCVLEQSY